MERKNIGIALAASAAALLFSGGCTTTPDMDADRGRASMHKSCGKACGNTAAPKSAKDRSSCKSPTGCNKSTNKNW